MKDKLLALCCITSGAYVNLHLWSLYHGHSFFEFQWMLLVIGIGCSVTSLLNKQEEHEKHVLLLEAYEGLESSPISEELVLGGKKVNSFFENMSAGEARTLTEERGESIQCRWDHVQNRVIIDELKEGVVTRRVVEPI